ncbi:MAG: tyrosinase family protein [bacterium]|nr:tyrosinase family protein [bacterium]
MAGTRKDIARLGTWSDELVWYALAVGELRSRALATRTSWLYLAAIHGINGQGWLDQGLISSTTPAPGRVERGRLFNQCQHAGWFFLPWHRGYLAAFESILADWIASQGGPADWALPYWNYLDASNSAARDIPQEFRDPTLPSHPATTAGDPNPLADALRGPAASLGPQTWIASDIDLAAQTEDTYTSDPGSLGYGGPISGFDQQGNAYGAIESNPHNFVHVMVGGGRTTGPDGWMSDPSFAALDPIFWVHHCNIDRLWAAWMDDPQNDQERSQPWRNGPFPRQFEMPRPDESLEVFVPEDTLPGGRLEPTYDSLTSGTGIAPPGPGVAAVTRPGSTSTSLIAANDAAVTIERGPVRTEVTFAAAPGPRVAAAGEERVFLNVEGVRGEAASGVLNVSIAAPGTGETVTETLVFFGLREASNTDGAHAGNGLSATIDVTEKVQALESAAGDSPGTLSVEISQPEEAAIRPITVDRVSLYRRRRG